MTSDQGRHGGAEPGPRLFTVAEANALLPVLRPILEALRDQKAALEEARVRLAAMSPTMRGNGHAVAAATLERRLAELASAMAAEARRVLALGVELKDLERGLIDFPSRRDDRVVFLCWQLGEAEIGYWHELDTGFAGRRPL